jgi:hypothetical protein
VDVFDGDGDGQGGLARRAADLARGQGREGSEALARRKDGVVDRARQRPGSSRRGRQPALERLLERGAVIRREAVKGEREGGGAAPGGGPLQGFAAYPRKLASASDSDS